MLKAKDLMTKDVLSISSALSVAQAIAVMQAEKVRSLIVISPDQPSEYGILTERDVVYKIVAPGCNPESVQVSDIMRAPCIPVHPDETIQEVATLFADTGIQRAPVMQGDTLVGVISTTDIIMKLEVGLQQPADILSRRIQEAILHRRIASDPEEQAKQETEIAWEIREQLEAQGEAEEDTRHER